MTKSNDPPEPLQKEEEQLKLQKLFDDLKLAELAKIQQQNELKARKLPKSGEEFKFWKTQPVPKMDEEITENGAIEPNKPREQVQQDPYPLPKDFEWCLVNVDDEQEIKDVYELLSLNYVEDDECAFRFDYSADFLKWALKPPGWNKNWLIGVRVSSNKKLVAFISGIPATLRMHEHRQLLVEINFLCVHKKLRSKRLAPMMIKEVTRRVHLEGIFQATYTAGVYLPKPFTVCRYFHRSLNPKKLIDIGFSRLGRNMTMARLIKLLKVPETTSTPGLRVMQDRDVKQVTVLLNEYLAKFKVAAHFSDAEVRHWMLPVKDVLYSYVVEDPTTHRLSDFFSFYSLPSSVMGNPKHTHLNAAYLFYHASKDMGADPKRMQALMRDALTLAKNNGFDVFNCLNLMDNASFLEELKFGRGDGNLHFYLYNYRCREVQPHETGLVLL